MYYEDPKIVFICQHNIDGSIIPIKFRLMDEDGVYKEYSIRGYRDTSKEGLICFDCSVVINGAAQVVRIYTSAVHPDGIWKLSIK